MEEKRFQKQPAKKLHAKRRVQNTPKASNNNNPNSTPKNMNRGVNGLKNQTPSSRRRQRANKKVDAFGSGVANRTSAQHNYTIKTLKKSRKAELQRKRQIFAKAVFLIGFVFGIFLLIGAGLFYNLHKTEKTEYHSVYQYVYVEGGFVKGEYDIVPAEKIYHNDEMWIDMQLLADRFGFTVTGDSNELRFIPDTSTGEYIRFFNDSPICEINGTEVIIGSNPIRTETEFWVPIEFLKSYMNHITYSYDSEKYILYVACDGSYNSSSVLVETKPDFKLKNTKHAEKINEDGLSVSVLNRTYFNSDVILYDSMGNIIYDPAKDPSKVTVDTIQDLTSTSIIN